MQFFHELELFVFLKRISVGTHKMIFTRVNIILMKMAGVSICCFPDNGENLHQLTCFGVCLASLPTLAIPLMLSMWIFWTSLIFFGFIFEFFGFVREFFGFLRNFFGFLCEICWCSEVMEHHRPGPEDQTEDQRQKGARNRNLVWRKVPLLFCQISFIFLKLFISKHSKGKHWKREL